MKPKEIESIFDQYCKVTGAKNERSHFEKGSSNYIVATPGSIYLTQADPRAGKTWAIMRNGDNGSVSVVYGFSAMERVIGYMEGIIAVASQFNK